MNENMKIGELMARLMYGDAEFEFKDGYAHCGYEASLFDDIAYNDDYYITYSSLKNLPLSEIQTLKSGFIRNEICIVMKRGLSYYADGKYIDLFKVEA